MTIRESVINQLIKMDIDPNSSRIPYTHHHDYVRSELDNMFLSRSDVSQLPYTEDELWSACFLMIVRNLTDKQKICSGIDTDFYCLCNDIANNHIKELQESLTIPCI